MRLPRFRFTVRRMMAVVGICALILWITPISIQYWFIWTVLSDVKRGNSTRYSPEAYSGIGPRSVQALRDALRSNQKKTRLAAVNTLGYIGRDGRTAVSDLAKPAIPDLIGAAL